MRYILLLIVMAFMLSCNIITNLGMSPVTDRVDTDAQTDHLDVTAVSTARVDYDAPADPLNVTVALNPGWRTPGRQSLWRTIRALGAGIQRTPDPDNSTVHADSA